MTELIGKARRYCQSCSMLGLMIDGVVDWSSERALPELEFRRYVRNEVCDECQSDP